MAAAAKRAMPLLPPGFTGSKKISIGDLMRSKSKNRK